jgi:hypothetical protein
MLSADERRNLIMHEIKQKAFALGLEWVEDEGLLEEVSGLAEWPVVLFAKIDPAFTDVPGEILQTAMRRHQKYFSLKTASANAKDASLSSHFAFVANMVALARKLAGDAVGDGAAAVGAAVGCEVLLGTGQEAPACVARGRSQEQCVSREDRHYAGSGDPHRLACHVHRGRARLRRGEIGAGRTAGEGRSRQRGGGRVP